MFTLSLEEMLAVKAKIETADAYASRNLPGNAFLSLLEAKEIAGTSFQDQIEPRVEATTSTLKDFIDVYKVNLRVVDNAGMGRSEYIQYTLLDKAYEPGIEMLPSGGDYTLTLDLRTLEVDEKTKIQSYIIQIPTGTTKSLNGEYAALQQKVNISCADYFAKSNAAQGAGLQAFTGFTQAINTASASNGTDFIGIALNIGKTVEASARMGAEDAAGYNCENAQEELYATSMFTTDTLTTPF